MSWRESRVNLDGVLLPAAEARIGVFDHGLLYGDALFETLRVYSGSFFRLEAHLERLGAGAERLGFHLPWPQETLATALRATARANALGDGVLRLTVTRGEGPPLPDPALCDRPRFFVVARPLPPCLSATGPPAPAGPVALGLVETAWRSPWIPALKTTCYLPWQQARQEARRRGFDDALLVVDGEVVEATASNLFLVSAGMLLTPRIESGCLPGITRAALLELARAAGIPCREARIEPDELAAADEAFLTSSVGEVIPVARIEDRELPTAPAAGPLTRRLHCLYREAVARECAP